MAVEAAIVARADDPSTPPMTLHILENQALYRMTLAGDLVWHIDASAKGCWSARRDWSAALGSDVALDLYAAAELDGAFVVTPGQAPERIKGWAHIVSDDQQAAEPIQCSLDLPRWRCTAPASLPFDLRVEPEGFAPVYFWGVVAGPSEPRELEERALIAGSSVAGWVEDSTGKAIENGRVTLAPIDETHGDLRRAEVTTNHQGFFQVTGIGPGEYRLVARSAGLAPSILPVLSIHAKESLRLPRVLTLVPPVTLNIALDPPKAPDGKHWMVALYERVPLVTGSTDPAVRQAASADGSWSARGLRSDAYHVVVQDSKDAVFEQLDVDLSKGVGSVLPVSIHSLSVRGDLHVGSEPLAAEIRFSNDSGKTVRVTTDSDGSFEVPFPGAGDWTPTIYPSGHNGPKIRAKTVRVPSDAKDTDRLDIRLAGGRIRGSVVVPSGEAVKAAVHVARSSELIAQQVTADDGKFDFIGLELSHYEVSAESMAGTTKLALPVDLRDDASADVTLTVDPYRAIRGIVMTPDGLPANGALVRVSTDGGRMWTDLDAAIDGTFEYSVPGATAEAELLVLTHSYPASLNRLRIDGASEPVSIRLGSQGGRLQVRGKAWIVRQDRVAPFVSFLLPYGDHSAYLEPGSYSVCAQPVLSDQCHQVFIGPGSESSVDMGVSAAGKAR